MLLFAVAATAFIVFFALERVRPLRKEVEPWPRRIARNLTVGAIAYIVCR